MLDNTFTYNGHSSDEFGIKIERRPDLSRSARKFKSASVPGRNGNIYQLENAWEEVVVAYDIFAGGSTEGDAIPSFTDIVEWLNSADDYVVLTDTYDPTHYRLGIFVDAIDIESAWYQHGKATVKFRCRPQRYLNRDIDFMPQMMPGTYTNKGVTAVVDTSGVVRVSGTPTGNVSITIPTYSSVTITQDMVDEGVSIRLNNTSQSNWTIDIGTVIGMGVNVANNSYLLAQTAVGDIISQIKLSTMSLNPVSFTFHPAMRRASTAISVADGDTINNSTNHTALPMITLTGSGARSLLNLGKPDPTMSITDNRYYGNLMLWIGWSHVGTSWDEHLGVGIDTNAYGTNNGGVINSIDNSTGTINFKTWDNDYGIGTAFEVTPNTDYVVSATASGGASNVFLAFFENSGNKYVGSTMEQSVSGSFELVFRTPVNCNNVLIIFYGTANVSASYTSIMLVGGTEALPFHPYASLTQETLTINDTTLQFQTSGFSTAVIDCERENFTVDGVNYNGQSTVLDQYGNISAEYLRLQSGSNTITYSHDITSVTIEPRFWEL